MSGFLLTSVNSDTHSDRIVLKLMQISQNFPRIFLFLNTPPPIMEGRLSMRPPNLRRRLPMLCICTFFVGGLIEFIMCSSGFYNVTSVNVISREIISYFSRVVETSSKLQGNAADSNSSLLAQLGPFSGRHWYSWMRFWTIKNH